MKRDVLFGALFLLLVLTTSFVSAQDYKIKITPTQEVFNAGEEVTFKISLLDPENNPIDTELEINLENTETGKTLDYTAPSNQLINVDLGEGANFGYWIITAPYEGVETKALFEIETEEVASFELDGEKLTVTNIGNTKYEKTIQIIIGETITTRSPNLDVDEAVEYRLVAPKGSYSIKVTDGVTTITQQEISLTGTGQAIGAIDERSSQRSGITGGIAPEQEDDIALLSFMKQGQLVYVFMLVIIGTFILIVVEKKFSKKSDSSKK